MGHVDHRIVVKLGGSLLVQRDLGRRLKEFLDVHYAGFQVCLIVGGGDVIESLRKLDQIHGCDAASMHWLCIQSLRTTFEFVSLLLPCAHRVDSPDAFGCLSAHWEPGLYLIAIDTYYSQRDCEVLSCDWSTTSDSLAALLAQRLGITRLCLLKSCDVPDDFTLSRAAEVGLVDRSIPAMVEHLDVTFARLSE